MLPLQCGKATAVFVPSRHRDFIAEVGNRDSRSLELLFLVLWPRFFYCSSIDEQYSYVRVFLENLVLGEVFFNSSTALKHTVFLSKVL